MTVTSVCDVPEREGLQGVRAHRFDFLGHNPRSGELTTSVAAASAEEKRCWLAKLRVIVGVTDASEHPRFRARSSASSARASRDETRSTLAARVSVWVWVWWVWVLWVSWVWVRVSAIVNQSESKRCLLLHICALTRLRLR